MGRGCRGSDGRAEPTFELLFTGRPYTGVRVVGSEERHDPDGLHGLGNEAERELLLVDQVSHSSRNHAVISSELASMSSMNEDSLQAMSAAGGPAVARPGR
jgi:hypothetical protein